MKVLLACLADYANADQAGNKLNVMGIFDVIRSKEFPARHPKMCLVFRLMFEQEDSGKAHKLSVVLRDADHREYQRLDEKIEAGAVPSGEFVSANQIIEMVDVVFAKPGRYHFALRPDNEAEFRVPLRLVKI